MKIIKRRIGKILLLGALCALFACGMNGEVKAEMDNETAYLDVGQTRMVKESEILQSEIRDDQGGTAVYDASTNTLTLTNFHINYKRGIRTTNMGDDFTIILQGENEILTGKRTSAITISHNNNFPCGLIMKGNGTLHADAAIIPQGKVRIENCTLDLNTDYFGIGEFDNDFIKIRNVNLTIHITEPVGRVMSFDAGGIMCKDLTIEHSNVSISVPDSTTRVWLSQSSDVTGYYYPQAIYLENSDDSDHMKLTLSEDETIVNAAGEPLYPVLFGDDRNREKYWAYTTKEFYDSWNIYDRYNYTQLTTTIEIKSTVKTQQNEEIKHVIALINQIGTVTNQSGEAIRTAKAAYDALSDDLKPRITNIAVLTEAESTYEKAVQEAVNEVIELINAIGTVDINSEEKIKRAQEAYNKLPDDQKSQVTNVDILNTAHITYQQVVAKAAEEKRLEEEKKKAEEEKKKAEEEKKKAEEKKKKSENKKQTGNEDSKSTGKNKDKKTSSKVTVKKTKITYLKSKKKNQLTVKWNKDKTCKGYQIAYSTNQKFKNAKFKIIKKWKTNTYTIKNLKSKKYYYVRIREYKVVKGKKVFGKWCKVKKLRIK